MPGPGSLALGFLGVHAWAVQISPAARLGSGMPAADIRFSTFQPSFLYELIFDLALAAALVWLGHHRQIRPQGLFALYVGGYSGYRIFEEAIRIDSSAYFLGLRLNFFVAIVMTAARLAWFVIVRVCGGFVCCRRRKQVCGVAKKP